MTPKFIGRILGSAWLWHVSRLLITFMYWYAGAGFAMNFTGTEAIMASTGVQPVWLVALLTIAVELIGSLLIIIGRGVWLGAGMLGAFTLMTIPLVHHFWTMSGLDAVQATLESEEHVTVIGGLIAISILGYAREQILRRGSAQTGSSLFGRSLAPVDDGESCTGE